MKKIICLISAFLCIFTGLCGCNTVNQKPISLEDSIIIPENGVIEASVFEMLKDENKAVIFKGQSGDLHYEWVIFGSDIKEAKELNLGIEILEANTDNVKFRFLSEENFGFTPLLSVYLNDVWDVQSASVCEDPATDTSKRREVSITGKEQTILKFTTEVQTGAFVITPDKTDAESSGTLEKTESSESTAMGNAALADSRRPVSDGKNTEQDQYKTDPVPSGKPLPAEPENQQIDSRKAYTCTLSIECSTVFDNTSDLNPDKLDIIPSNGIIFAPQTVTFYEGESVYDLLQRVCKENKIHMEASFTPMYNSAYVEGIGNLYEFDCGSGSGWMYRVDGWYPNYGCSRYQLKQGERVEWRYTCDLGSDIGGGYAMGE